MYHRNKWYITHSSWSITVTSSQSRKYVLSISSNKQPSGKPNLANFSIVWEVAEFTIFWLGINHYQWMHCHGCSGQSHECIKQLVQMACWVGIASKSASVLATKQNCKLDSSFCKYENVLHKVSLKSCLPGRMITTSSHLDTKFQSSWIEMLKVWATVYIPFLYFFVSSASYILLSSPFCTYVWNIHSYA